MYVCLHKMLFIHFFKIQSVFAISKWSTVFSNLLFLIITTAYTLGMAILIIISTIAIIILVNIKIHKYILVSICISTTHFKFVNTFKLRNINIYALDLGIIRQDNAGIIVWEIKAKLFTIGIEKMSTLVH